MRWEVIENMGSRESVGFSIWFFSFFWSQRKSWTLRIFDSFEFRIRIRFFSKNKFKIIENGIYDSKIKKNGIYTRKNEKNVFRYHVVSFSFFILVFIAFFIEWMKSKQKRTWQVITNDNVSDILYLMIDFTEEIDSIVF